MRGVIFSSVSLSKNEKKGKLRGGRGGNENVMEK